MVFQLVILAALVANAELAPAMPAYQTSPNIIPGPATPNRILPYPAPNDQYSPVIYDNFQLPHVSQSVNQGPYSQNYVIIDQSPLQLPTILQTAYQTYLDTIKSQVYVPQPQPISIPPQSLPLGPQPIPTPVLQIQPQPYQLGQVQQPYPLVQVQQPYQQAQIQQPVQLMQTY